MQDEKSNASSGISKEFGFRKGVKLVQSNMEEGEEDEE